MIEEISGLPGGTLGFKITGRVTGADYDDVLTPSVESAIAEYDRIKLLVQIGPGFEGYDLEAAWDDAKLGMRHWHGFERVAVVTDSKWVRVGMRTFGLLMPCPVQLFNLEEVDTARRWLAESLGSIHVMQESDVVIVRLIGKLEPSAYDGVSKEIDTVMSRSTPVRLLLDLREFDGWSGLAALGDHLELVREHRRVPQRVAVVGDEAWQHLAERVMSRFINAETRYFDESDYDGAVAWVAA